MDDVEEGQEEQLTLGGVGQKLREARERAGLDLAQVAAETKIPERHLVVMENGDWAALPARTYAVGFSRSYARMVGLDEKAIAAEVREELVGNSEGRGERAPQFEPGDPARIPSRKLAWISVFAALLLIVGGFSFYRSHLVPGSGPPSLLTQMEADEAQIEADDGESAELNAANAAENSPPIDPQGQVVFTALEEGIWARFYDGNGNRLFEKQMAEGERFVVPVDASGPQIWTGRPDAFAITVGGQTIAKLSDEERVLRDVAVDAASLLARPDAGEQSEDESTAN